MDTQTIQTVLILLTLLLAGWAVYKATQAGEIKDFTPAVLVDAVHTAQPQAVELLEVAQVAVNAVEQMRREGKILDNDVAFNRALDLVKKWIPDAWEVDNEDVIAAINAAVLVASSLSKQAGRSSEHESHEG